MTKSRSGKQESTRESERAVPLLQHILVGTGGSSPSISALRHALHLARRSASRVEALIVEELRLPSGAYLGDGDVLQRLVDDAQELVQAHWDQVERAVRSAARDHGVSIEARRVSGSVADRICEAAEAATLVVLGKTGYRSDHGGLLGSNTETILRRTHKPVLLAPDLFEPPNSIVVAYRGSAPGRVSLELGLALSSALNLPLFVFTVEEDSERCATIWDEARRNFPDLDSAAFFEADRGDVAEAIVRRTNPRSMLVMGAYGHPRLYRLVLGSVTQEVMRAARGPVLLCGK